MVAAAVDAEEASFVSVFVFSLSGIAVLTDPICPEDLRTALFAADYLLGSRVRLGVHFFLACDLGLNLERTLHFFK